MIIVLMILILMCVDRLWCVRWLMVVAWLISVLRLVWYLWLMITCGFMVRWYISWLMRFWMRYRRRSMIDWSFNMWSFLCWMRWVCWNRRVRYFFCLMWSIM